MPGLLRRRSNRPKILCYVNHYFGRDSDFIGKSTVGDPGVRAEIVRHVVDSIRGLPMAVDVRICGFAESSLVPIDLDLSVIGDPRHIVYAGIEKMFDSIDDYDYFLNIEDDILIDAQTVACMMRFTETSETNEVYLPNRMERDAVGGFYCVDQLSIPGWDGLDREFEGVQIDSATNPHSGLMFLSREQMRYARSRIDLSRRDRFHGGYMASAYANVHLPFVLWRAKSDQMVHHVVHLDRWLEAPDASAVASSTHPEGGAVEPPRSQGHLDELSLNGLICTLRGWSVSASGEPMLVRALSFAGEELTEFEVQRTPRPDVATIYPWAHTESGFVLTFSLLDLSAQALQSAEFAVVGDDGQGDVQLNISPTAFWSTARVQRAVAEAPQIGDQPFMPPVAVERLVQLLEGASCYLEYGTGGTTVTAARLGVPHILGVESDPSWLAAVRHKLDVDGRSRSVELLGIDIGPTGEWGFPTSDIAWQDYRNYPMQPWDHCRKSGLSPDVVLVDGRFRAACLVASVLYAEPGTRILFDDYYDRPHYFWVEQVIRPEGRHDRVAEFVVPLDKPVEALWRALLDAVTDTR